VLNYSTPLSDVDSRRAIVASNSRRSNPAATL
jgi:hypothetical protein